MYNRETVKININLVNNKLMKHDCIGIELPIKVGPINSTLIQINWNRTHQTFEIIANFHCKLCHG